MKYLSLDNGNLKVSNITCRRKNTNTGSRSAAATEFCPAGRSRLYPEPFPGEKAPLDGEKPQSPACQSGALRV